MAAAVTQINGMVTSGPPQPDRTIEFDRPFHYQIIHAETGLPLFMGTVAEADLADSPSVAHAGGLRPGRSQGDAPSPQAHAVERAGVPRTAQYGAALPQRVEGRAGSHTVADTGGDK